MKKRITKRSSKAATRKTISTWEQDPGSGEQPTGGPLVQRPSPKLSQTPLPTTIRKPSSAPSPKIYAPGTPEFRYWVAADALRRGSDYWGALLPGVRWEVGARLPVDLDHGVDLNAYYDRVGLRFFHGTAGGRTVYSGESADVVCHELGHALLDSIKPQLWDAASIEVAAFHESFGDMSAILTALQLPSLRQAVLTETGGVFYRSSRLSRLAEQLGWAIRQEYPTAADRDCLRNAVNSFFYRDPHTLPSSGPATTLSSEPHSFSRVFTGGFFEALAGMLKARPARDEANLLQVSQDMGRILTAAIRGAAVVPTFYSQVAANMVQLADAQFKGYRQAMKSAFVRHGVLAPAAAVAIPAAAGRVRGMGAQPERLPTITLPVAEYGFGVDAITVHAAVAAAPRGVKAAGAAVASRSITPPSNEEAAKSFLDDLVRRGRLKVEGIPRTRALVSRPHAPETHETYTHELRREGRAVVLRRVRIDCVSCPDPVA
ncbi:MAG: hypothetical protein IT515_18850 [Burkholderiales bacterium]|nr:hypothetical protein [Burkholderiales bacterium]